MEILYRPYLYLTAGQLKLLCFLAYTGRTSNRQLLATYKHGEELTADQLKALVNSLRAYFKTEYYNYRDEYQLHPYHVAPLMLYMMEQRQQWLEHFAKFYANLQHPRILRLQNTLQQCLEGHPVVNTRIQNSPDYVNMLVPLACDERFLPMLQGLSDPSFVQDAVIWQVEHDVSDPQNVVGMVLREASPRPDIDRLSSIVALYDFFKQGRYDAATLGKNDMLAYILQGAKALYASDYERAFQLLSAAIRDRNRGENSSQKGFFNMVLNNYLLVMAYYFHKPDAGKKLAALVKKDLFRDRSGFTPIVWLADYLVTGTVPTQRSVARFMESATASTISPLYRYLALLITRFFGLDAEMPKSLPPVPELRFLLHELSPWLSIPEEVRQQLYDEFGGEPLLSRIRYKQPWELLIEELTPHVEKGASAMEEKEVRVGYFIMGDRAEVREQKRLKSGAWSAGKRMSLDTFHRGTDFMDEADRRVANVVHGYYYYDVPLYTLLPNMVGTDRVYSGYHSPYTPVTIEEEKPYLIIERSKTAFSVKSNIGNADLSKPAVWRKDSDTHYTVITLTDRQRSYYQKLLRLGALPLEAEEQLRAFLPKVSDFVEVHSDLVEGGSTLKQRDGSPLLCLQVTPLSPSQGGQYNVWCMARPLPDGKTLLDPGLGVNPCVAESDGVRYQVPRDIRGERENLKILRTFIEDNNLTHEEADDLFSGRTPVVLDVEGLLLLMDFVRQQPDHFYMEWPEGGQLNLKLSQPGNWNISLQSKSGWFEVEGEIPIDEDTVLTAGQLLQLVAESPDKGFVRLNDTDFLSISDRLRRQLARLESLTVSNRGHLQISELHASLLGSVLSGEVDIKHDKKIEELEKKIKQSMAQHPDAPRQLKADLREYQADGYQWMNRMTGWGAGVCLADDMGLGKTVQTIAFMLHTADQGPALVAAPASVVLNWRRELERFAPSLHVEVLNASSDRKATIGQATAGDVVLTTYGLFVTEQETLTQKQWNTVCLDEAHVIKNRQTKTSAAVMQLQATHRIILTGTPVQNHLGELWNLFQFINPGLLGSHDQFHKKYIVPIELQDNKERSRQLKRIVSPFMLRRTKQEVIEELPDKTEVNMPVELSDEEMAVYEVIRRRAKQLLEDEQSSSGVSVNTLAEITRLRQAACSAQLAEKGWTGECSKLNVLSDLLQEIVGGGNAVLVFSQFTSFLAMVRQRLDKEKVAYLYLDGSVPIKQREQLVQQFQRGQCPVFLISLKAGGLGLNLTGANYVIHLDPWWNPAIEQQATDRAYRIGQRQNVTVYHLISQHTIEEKILRLHQTKRNLADAMLSGTNESHKLTSKELLEMIGG